MTEAASTRGKIIAHHVGGRGLSGTLSCPPSFEADIVHVLYEADAACARAMAAENRRPNRFILPFCLGARDGVDRFHLTANPYASSSLEPSSRYADYYCEVMLSGAIDGVDAQDAYYDAVYGRENRVTETMSVEVRSLDSIAARNGFPLDVLPDFLSLDTQGSEHAILMGAANVLRSGVLGIVTEIQFHPMYRDQPLFSAILDFAIGHGFHFAGFTHLQEISPFRAPVGQRANGFTAFGDALFLRRVETLDDVAATAEERYVKALKLAFLSIAFGYLEYGLQTLQYALRQERTPASTDAPGALHYPDFLRELVDAAAAMPAYHLHDDRYQLVEQLRTGALPRKAPDERVHRYGAVAQWMEQRVPVVYRPLRSALILGTKGIAAWRSDKGPVLAGETRLEQVLGNHGFGALKDTVRRRRLAASPFASRAAREPC